MSAQEVAVLGITVMAVLVLFELFQSLAERRKFCCKECADAAADTQE